MPFLLVAPLNGRAGGPFTTSAHSQAWFESVLEPGRQQGAGTVFSTRADSLPLIVDQTWTKLSLSTSPVDAHPDVRELWMVSSRGMTALVLDVAMDDEHLPAEVLEATLTATAQWIVAHTPSLAEAEVAWVGRILVTRDGSSPDSWLLDSQGTSDSDTSIELGPPDMRLTTGWGNNLLVHPEESPDVALLDSVHIRSAIEGIVDGQLLWLELDWVSGRSSRLVLSTLRGGSGRVARAEYSRVSRELSELSSAMAVHQLAFDDLRVRVQGVRRSVGICALTAWGYSEASERIDRRLGEIGRVVESWRGQLDNRYQGAAELILITLSLVTSLDLALSFISTSFIGTDGIPGSRSPWGVLSWFRHTDSDVVLLGMAIILAVVGAGVILTRAMRRR